LIAAQLSKSPLDGDTDQSVASLPDKMAGRLVAVGPIAQRQEHVPTSLTELLDSFLAWKRRAKPATREIWQQPIRNLKAFYGDTRDISTVTEEDAEAFKNYLLDGGLASTTVSKRLQFTRGFFKFAVKRKLITQNPFEDVSEIAVALPDTTW
jgi:site-specific recombinase XerD